MPTSRLKLMIIIVLFHGFLLSTTKNISGIILDSETKEPINNANIYIKKYEIGTITNQEGYFLLSINNIEEKKINLNVKVIGYEEKIILLDLSDYFNCKNCKIRDLGEISINKNPIKLKTLHVHSHQNESNQISDIIISDSELDENLKSNIATTLSNYPNIGINSFGSVTSKPALRGFSGDRFLLTKNGDETGDLAQSSIDHVITLDMSEVNRIEVIRGPKSLVFGANAIGGVVNTSLIGDPKVKVEKIFQKYFFGRESFNDGIYGNMMFYIPIYNNQLNLFISDKVTDNELTPIGELINTESHTMNHKIRLTNYNRIGYFSYSLENFNMDYGIPPAPGFGHTEGVDILLRKKTEQIIYHRDLLSKFFNELNVKLNFIEYLHLEDSSFENSDIDEVFEGGQYHVGLSKNTKEMEIEFNSDNSVLGLECNTKDFKGYEYYFTPYTEESYFSFYGYKEKKYKELDFLGSFRMGYLTVDPDTNGVQFNNIDGSGVRKRSFKTTSFSIGIRKKVDNFESNTWIMQTMRAPRAEELFSDGPHLGNYSYEIGNPNLKVEKIFGIENSISFDSHPFRWSLVMFYNKSPYYYEMAKMGDCPEAVDWDPWSGESYPCYPNDEYVEWGAGGSDGPGYLYKYNSRGSKVKIKGLEFDFKYELSKFKLAYNFSFVRGDNRTLDRPLSYMNPMKQILSLDYGENRMNYKIRFSKIHAQDRLGEFETYTPGAFLTDFILSYRYKGHNLTIQVNNIFDEKYYNHLSRIKDLSPEPGQNIHFIYKVSF